MKHPRVNTEKDLLGLFRSLDEAPRSARLFRNGRNQAVRLPRDMEIDAEEVWIYRVGGRLVMEPKRPCWTDLADAPPVHDGFLSEWPAIGIDPADRDT